MLNNSLNKIFAEPVNKILLSLPWTDWIEKVGRLTWEYVAARGMYEVQEYESTLELLDTSGRKAVFQKRQRVRYLQDHIIAYQDQAWGEGRILLDYRCTPGYPVDRYQLGHKTFILISLREVKRRGDIDEFHIQWGIRDGFRKKQESWETEISHRTKRFRLRVIFPADRPPRRKICIEASRQISRPISSDHFQLLPDGRWQVICDMEHPRLNERYLLRWDW